MHAIHQLMNHFRLFRSGFVAVFIAPLLDTFTVWFTASQGVNRVETVLVVVPLIPAIFTQVNKALNTTRNISLRFA